MSVKFLRQELIMSGVRIVMVQQVNALNKKNQYKLVWMVPERLKKYKSTNLTGWKTFKLGVKDGKQRKNKGKVEKGMQHKSKGAVAVVCGWDLVVFIGYFLVGLCLNLQCEPQGSVGWIRMESNYRWEE